MAAPTELLTTGQKIHTDMKVLLWPNRQETFIPGFAANTRFRLILIEKGAGILRLGDTLMAFNAPALLCLNEHEVPVLEQGADIQATSLYFHPSVINSLFSFEKVRLEPAHENFGVSDTQDQYWLQAFTTRNSTWHGLMSLGVISANQIARQLARVEQELGEQRDGYWPCRSRSYFLELLFLIDRLYREPNVAEIGVLSQVTSTADIGSVILYLHTNYQKKITLADLTRSFQTNRTTLTRQFREATGLPVMTYLINLRMHLASLMLRNTTVTVAEVMERVGFSDDTHFTRAFRKYTHLTPSEYRRQHCWMLQ
jgi:AraC-like DNA-binding protein